MLPVISAEDARTLLMDAQGLLDDPARKATPKSVLALIERLGFVQVDSINVIDRAQHLTLATRLTGYREAHLAQLLEQRRDLFEHWTHDASAIPSDFFAHWKPRFRRFGKGARHERWMRQRMGDEPHKVLAQVLRRIRREGPLMSQDFEVEEGVERGPWWGWAPHKTALECLWHQGKLMVSARRGGFNKVYDLTERVLPERVRERMPGPRAHVEWACSGALERLGVAAPGEIAHFWQAVKPAEATAWCKEAARKGRIAPVLVEDAQNGVQRKAFAVPDWEARVARAPSPPGGLRLVSPFDPVIRDRRRLERRFGFEHRFEAFVPAAKRRWGYYVLPLLAGDRFVGRIDPKLHREQETLEIRKVHWERGFAATPARRRALDAALAQLAERVGAKKVDVRR